jgi:hypothetical protein
MPQQLTLLNERRKAIQNLRRIAARLSTKLSGWKLSETRKQIAFTDCQKDWQAQAKRKVGFKLLSTAPAQTG